MNNIKIINRNKKNNKNKYRPCIIYNKNINYPGSISVIDIKKIIKKKEHIVNLNINKKKSICLIKEIQYDVFKKEVYHIDFFKIDKKEPFICYINVNTIGNSIGVTKGGICHVVLKKIKVLTNIKNYLNEFLIDISKLDIGDKIYIKDIIKENIKILEPLDKIIITIKVNKLNEEE